MSNLGKLISGDLDRAYRYHVLTIGVSVSFLWFIVMAVISVDQVNAMLPLFILVDSAVMSVLLISASLFYERQEGTLKTVVMAPVSAIEIIISKIILSVIISLLSAMIVIGGAYIFHNMQINIGLLLTYIVLISSLHSIIGITLTLLSVDFSSMLINFSGLILLCDFPAVLYGLGAFPKWTEMVLVFLPTQAAQILIQSTVLPVSLLKILISIGVLVAWTVILMTAFVYRKFKQYIAKV